MTAPSLTARRRPGRPRSCPYELLVRIVNLYEGGARQQDICDQLNAEGVLTPGGGKHWWPSHVSRLLRTIDAQLVIDRDDHHRPREAP